MGFRLGSWGFVGGGFFEFDCKMGLNGYEFLLKFSKKNKLKPNEEEDEQEVMEFPQNIAFSS